MNEDEKNLTPVLQFLEEISRMNWIKSAMCTFLRLNLCLEDMKETYK